MLPGSNLLLSTLLLCCAACMSPPQDSQDPERRPAALGYGQYGGTMSVLIGLRRMQDQGDWDPLENQLTGGLETTLYGRPGNPVALTAGVLGSYEQASRTVSGVRYTLDTESVELYLGPKLFVDVPDTPLRLYAGLGVSAIYYGAEYLSGGAVRESDDISAGLYAHAGVSFWLTDTTSIGIGYRTLQGSDVDLAVQGQDADYHSVQLSFNTEF